MPHSERSKAIIEPKLSQQWYVKMKDLKLSPLQTRREAVSSSFIRKAGKKLTYIGSIIFKTGVFLGSFGGDIESPSGIAKIAKARPRESMIQAHVNTVDLQSLNKTPTS